MKVTAYFENMRISHWWWWIGVCAIAAYIFNPEVEIKPLLLVILGFSFLFASGYSLNNTYDHNSDRWNPSKRNPVAEGKISFEESGAESMILGVAGLIFLGLVSLEGLIGGVLLLILYIVYQAPPIRTKARPYLDVITITLLYSMPFFIGYSSVGSIDLRGTGLALLFGLLSGTTHPLQTAKDIEGDRKNGDTTISVLIGVKRSIILSLILLISTMVYLEVLILAELLDPRLFFIPITIIPALLYYSYALADPSNRKIGNTWQILRLNAGVGVILALFLISI